MYVRPSNQPRQQIHIPENYSGNAFGNHSFSDMPPPVRSTPRYDAPSRQGLDIPPESKFEPDTKHNIYERPINDEIYQNNELNEKSNYDDEAAPAHSSALPSHIADKEEKSKKGNSLLSSLLPNFSSNSSSFPFGHGLGSEELLILGVMLLLYISGNETGEFDREFMLLLGLLLFAG